MQKRVLPLTPDFHYKQPVEELVVLQVYGETHYFPCSALHSIVGYEFQGREFSLLHCLENPEIMAPVDYLHLSIKLEDLVGKIIKINKIYFS